MTETVEMGRLALRIEGDSWVGYFAQKGTMEGAIELGRIEFGLVVRNDERRDQFKQLMQECVADIIELGTGTRPSFHPDQPAPEHEKAGHA